MGAKGNQTKTHICEEAYKLFSERGYKDVTMKDICERTGLSRGGLYRHYGSTREIFEEIINQLSDSDHSYVREQIAQGISARTLLENILSRMQDEMLDKDRSLGYAIYEYSNVHGSEFMSKLNADANEKWRLLLEYGISTAEFKPVDIGQMTDIILYAYQGIRMWSRVIPISRQTSENIIAKIRNDLLPQNNNAILLVRPTPKLKEQALEYRNAHFENGETVINGSELFDQIESYEEWLTSVSRNANPKTVNESWVVTDTFFAVRENDRKIVGIIDLRHTLNDFLKDFGNCGYSVHPSERGKGYATEMLRQILNIARNIGLTEIHLSVEKSNEASIKVIRKNGGIYERSFLHENELADIYRITL